MTMVQGVGAAANYVTAPNQNDPNQRSRINTIARGMDASKGSSKAKGSFVADTFLGGGLGLFQQWDDPEEIPYDPYWAYTPEQKQMHQTLGPYLTGKMNGQLDLYKGDYTADMTQAERDVLSQNARMSALGEAGLNPLLRGEFPEEYYQNTLYNPQLKKFQEDIQPALEEQYAGPNGSGYWGSARAGAVAKGYRDLGDTLAAQRAQLAWNVQQNVPNAIAAANALSTTGAAIQATPRLIQQYGLDQQYKEWTRGKEESQKYIDQALNFMGLSSGVMDIGNTDIGGGGGGLNLGNVGQLASMFQGIGSVGGNPNASVSEGYGGYFEPANSRSYNLNNYYGSNAGGLNAASNNYALSALNGMDWRNTGNYSLGNGNYGYTNVGLEGGAGGGW